MTDKNSNNGKDEVTELALFDPTRKKKKKKKTSAILECTDDSVDTITEKTESLSVSEGAASTFVGLKKKKEKPVETSILDEESVEAIENLDDKDFKFNNHAGDDEGEVLELQQQHYPWEASDCDYIYEDNPGRHHSPPILRENNPEVAGDRRRTVMRPPQVLREGTKRTVPI
ncbi:eukaryotic translation initiation factor 2 subunit beta-like [Euphorbia lathyris]|uniref:eukaryotic translation initiation factor 2 subunit beta-like n=1 Tax=Euphorbia lathyris TaxID=212925 RepID=UPI00331442E8